MPETNANTTPITKKPAPPKPLTDPADLFRLIGRFFASLILTVFAINYVIKQDTGGAIALGLIAIVMQLWTIRLWRQLREQRMEAKAARAEAMQRETEKATT